MPHCFVFFDDEDNMKGMLLIFKTGAAYQLPNVEHVWQIFSVLMSMYYVFDLQYFAAFGVLSVLDKYIFHMDDEPGLVPPPSKRAKKNSTPLAVFMEKFDAFVAEDLVRMSTEHPN